MAERQPGQSFEIAVLALQNTTLFPETVVPLAVGRPRSVAAVEAALATEEKLLACITVRADASNTSQDAGPTDLYQVGTLTMIKRMERLGETMHIIAQGTGKTDNSTAIGRDDRPARVLHHRTKTIPIRNTLFPAILAKKCSNFVIVR